jgi:NAD+ synthase
MNINWKNLETHLKLFLFDEISKTGLKTAVIGLSGGIDSAVVAVLLKKAFENKPDFNLIAVLMPSQYSSQNSIDDAIILAKKFNIEHKIVQIDDYISVFNEKNTKSGSLRIGNFSARMRMATLYDISAEERALVIGTSNKSELLLGYGTIFGDLASSVNPIGDLYKTEIFEFAKYLGVPDEIVNKPPSADLFEGQTDENELGYSYNELDSVLIEHVQNRKTESELIKNGFDSKLVKTVIKKIYLNQFKRKMPVIAKVRDRTINIDFLYPRDIKL